MAIETWDEIRTPWHVARAGTVVPELCTSVIAALAPLLGKHLPALNLRLRTVRRLLRLGYGEAHVAIRAGSRPREPDNIVPLVARQPVTLYAEFNAHFFVGDDLDDSRAPYSRWIAALGVRQVARRNDPPGRLAALRAGLGLGFLAEGAECAGVVQVMPSGPEWQVPLWLVTRVDLHRTAKMQAAA